MPHKKPEKWFTHTIQDLAQALKIHRSTVYRLISSGQFRQGIHYIDLRQPSAQRGLLRFDLDAVQGTMSRHRK